MASKDEVIHSYYRVLDLLDKAPGEEEVIDFLIALENSIQSYLFATLQEKYKENRINTNVYTKFQNGKGDRASLEGLVMSSVTGDRVSISELIDVFLKKITEILNVSQTIQDKISSLSIQYVHLKETILPPDYKKNPEVGSGNGRIEKEVKTDKFDLLIQYFREWGIYTDDLLVMDGENSTPMTRKESYYCIYIPKIKKTMFINNAYGEATFVYDDALNVDRFTEFGKEGLHSIAKKINFTEGNIDRWKQEIYRSLFMDDNGKKNIPSEKIDVKKIKTNIDKKIQRKFFIDYYSELPGTVQTDIMSSNARYKKRAKDKDFPKTYYGLITLLGGDPICVDAGYVKALIKGIGDEYFTKWKCAKDSIIQITRQDFLNTYIHLLDEEQKIIISSREVYAKRAKNYTGAPKSYDGLITLLGGDNKCKEGGYVKALIEGVGPAYLLAWEQRNQEKKIITKQDFLDMYNDVSGVIKSLVIQGGSAYKKRASQYKDFPQSYSGLTTLLGGDSSCYEGGYVKALIEGVGEKYFNDRKIRSTKTAVQKKQEFLDFYVKLLPEDRKRIITGHASYSIRAKTCKDIPRSYHGLISLLGGSPKCLEGGYVAALIEGKGEAYFTDWEISYNKKISTKKEFLDFYAALPDPDKKNILCGAKIYRSISTKKYPMLPKSYEALVYLLGGDRACAEQGYIVALMEGTGDKYLEKWQSNRAQKIQNKEDFLTFYKGLLKHEQIKIVNSCPSYMKYANTHSNLPKSYHGLVSLLGGNRACVEGGYVKALIEGTGTTYFQQWEENNNKSADQHRQEFLAFYTLLPAHEKDEMVNGSSRYSKLTKLYHQIPKSYSGLIFLLGGNPKCLEGGYVAALIEGKGAIYFEKWENLKSQKICTREKFLDFYETLLAHEKEEMVFSAHMYKNKLAKRYPALPQSYCGLISLLGGNKICLESGYVQALIAGTGESYFHERKKRKSR